MNFLKTRYHELHEDQWIATLKDSRELVCMHKKLKDLEECIENMGLADKVIYGKL